MIKNIFRGIKAYGGTFKLINELKLWRYFGVPMLISFVTAILIGTAAWGLSDNIGHWIAGIWIWDWGKNTFETIATILGAVIIIALGLLLYKHIVMAFSAPFMTPVSEKIEKHILGADFVAEQQQSKFRSQLWRAIRLNVRNLFMEILLTLPILLLGLIPLIGFLSGPLLFLMQAFYVGFGNMDYTLERYFNYDESIKFVKKNKGIATGNGVLFMLMLMIPIIGIVLVLPLSVTAATTETIRLLHDEGKITLKKEAES